MRKTYAAVVAEAPPQQEAEEEKAQVMSKNHAP